MTGTAAATFPTSSSVCIIFFILACEEIIIKRSQTKRDTLVAKLAITMIVQHFIVVHIKIWQYPSVILYKAQFSMQYNFEERSYRSPILIEQASTEMPTKSSEKCWKRGHGVSAWARGGFGRQVIFIKNKIKRGFWFILTLYLNKATSDLSLTITG